VIGIDMGLALTLAGTLGYDAVGVADLLPEAEGGLLEGFARLRTESDT
jgi:hypothetical protein